MKIILFQSAFYSPTNGKAYFVHCKPLDLIPYNLYTFVFVCRVKDEHTRLVLVCSNHK
jgi:hypothetical protein